MKIFNKIIASLMLVSSVVFANSVGTITALSGSASIVRGGENIVATLGAALSDKDSITTKENSKVQVIFNDETIVTIGKNSNFSIDEYLYEENKTPTAKFGLVSGAMNTITGKIGKVAPDKFSVKTKTATIGIRGTNFAVEAKEDGSSVVYCTFGAITVSINGETSTVTQGFYTVVSPAGKISTPTKFTPQALDKMRSNSFTSTSSKKEDVKEQSEAKKEDVAELKTEEAKEVSDATSTITSDDIETPMDAIEVQDIDTLVSDLEEQTSDAIQDELNDEDGFSELNFLSLVGPISNTDFSSNMDYYFDGAVYLDKENADTLALYYRTMDGLYIYVTGALEEQANSNFNVEFTEAYVPEYIDTNINNLNVELIEDPDSNYIRTTQDDLSASDAMIWGEWSTHISYDDISMESPIQSGLWMMGEETPVSIIDGYRTSNMVAHYDGIYKAYSYAPDGPKIETGVADMIVYFGEGTASLNIYDPTDSTNIWENYDMRTESGDIYMQGNGTFNISSSASGEFFGAEGKSVGGNFAISDGDMITTKGVYEVTTTSIEARTQQVAP